MKKTLRIAFADDEDLVRALLRLQLALLGHVVVLEARSGQELLRGLANVTADLVITDIGMDNLDGIDAAELMSARYELPVIFMSGHDIDTVQFRLRSTKACTYLAKPFSIEQLKASIVMTMQRFNDGSSKYHEHSRISQPLDSFRGGSELPPAARR